MSVASAELLRQENKNRILQTVKTLLNQYHFSDLSLGAVAAKAGVAVKTINNIFGTKNSLLILTAISAYTEEHFLLDRLVASSAFLEKSGLEQVMALHYERAKLQREYPYVACVVSEIERLRLTNETEVEQCNQFLSLAHTISIYYEDPLKKGYQDGSIKRNISSDEIQSILFFSFGAILQKLQAISINAFMNEKVDAYATLRTILKMTRDYIGK